MSDEFIGQLSQELDRRKLSYRKIAEQIKFSHTLISKVLSGKMPPSPDFCIKIARALDEPPEKWLRLAGHLPPPSEPDAPDQVIQDLVEIARSLPPEDRHELLEYARFRYRRRKG